MSTVTRTLGAITCVSAMLMASAGISAAQTWDRRTIFTFSAPVTIPGATLPAGKYVFTIADPNSSRKVIQVTSGDDKKPIALLFSISAQRPEASEKPEVRFLETAAGVPPAVKTWWYPGDRMGFEFVYPKDQARRLAQGSSGSVLTTQAQTTSTEQTRTGELTRISGSGEESTVSANPSSAAPTGTSQQGDVYQQAAGSEPNRPAAQVAYAAPQNPNPGAAAPRRELPATASDRVTIAVFGMASLAFGCALWMRRRSFSGNW